MNVKWQHASEPDVGRWGISKQCILLSSVGSYNTGYWDRNNQKWLVEGLMMGREYIVAWLEGLENAKNSSEESFTGIEESSTGGTSI